MRGRMVFVRIGFLSFFVCVSNKQTDRVLYPEERLVRIANEAAQGDIIYSLNDRIGLVHDAMALAKSGHATVSSALTVVDIFRNETECQCFYFQSVISLTWTVVLVWDSIAENLALLTSTWWENKAIVKGLNEFRKLSIIIPPHPIIKLICRAESLQTNRG